ncbi:hypothetical protein VTH06DRAFT_8689 [Thermothelomyces fergusii]
MLTKPNPICRTRYHPTQDFMALYFRAITQRFCVISRIRHTIRRRRPDLFLSHPHKGATKQEEKKEEEEEEEPCETVVLTGSCGNVYKVTISRFPGCNCPQRGRQCKHVVFVLARVLRAKFEYVYQLALLGSELRETLDKAPPPSPGDARGEGTGERKPVEGDCPICYSEMGEAAGAEALVWCRAACGRNMHRACFQVWAATEKIRAKMRNMSGDGEVTCPCCRTVWEDDEGMLMMIRGDVKRSAGGYINIGSLLADRAQQGESSQAGRATSQLQFPGS